MLKDIDRGQLHRFEEFMQKTDKHGCVRVTDWVSGSGRFTKPRATPIFVKEYKKEDANLSWNAKKFFEENTRCKKCLAFDKQAFNEYRHYGLKYSDELKIILLETQARFSTFSV